MVGYEHKTSWKCVSCTLIWPVHTRDKTISKFPKLGGMYGHWSFLSVSAFVVY